MASFFCHVFAGTKRFRLERIVRAQLAEMSRGLTTRPPPARPEAKTLLQSSSDCALPVGFGRNTRFQPPHSCEQTQVADSLRCGLARRERFTKATELCGGDQ